MLHEQFEEETPDFAAPLTPHNYYSRQAELIRGAYIRKLFFTERLYQRYRLVRLSTLVTFIISTILTGIFLVTVLLNNTNDWVLVSGLILVILSTIASGLTMVRDSSVHKPAMKSIQRSAEALRRDLAFNWIQGRYGFSLTHSDEIYESLFIPQKQRPSIPEVIQLDDGNLIQSAYIVDKGYIICYYGSSEECSAYTRTQFITDITNQE